MTAFNQLVLTLRILINISPMHTDETQMTFRGVEGLIEFHEHLVSPFQMVYSLRRGLTTRSKSLQVLNTVLLQPHAYPLGHHRCPQALFIEVD